MKRGLLQVLVANIINLCVSLLNGFFLPKYLSVESYAMIKTYTLYITYVGFFHLGYLDGMYLKYGGKTLSDIDKDEFGSDFKNVALFQSIVGVVIAFIALLLKDNIILAFAFGLVLNNIINCFQMLFQAVGEFKLYSSALNFKTVIAFVGSMFFLFIVRTDNYIPYVACQVLASVIPAIYLAIILNNKLHFLHAGKISLKAYKENISSGFVLMIGNFSSSMFTGIDRWFVKILMSTATFATYSFAVSVDTLVTTFITPITVTLYNSLCKIDDNEKIKELKRMVLIWGFCVITLAFPAKWFIQHFLDKYVDAINIIFCLFATQVLYAVIKGVYVNLYKARKQQNIYFVQMISMIALAAALDGTLYFIFRSSFALAVGTLLTAIIWLIVDELKGDVRFNVKEYVLIIISMATFLVCGMKCNAILGCIIYLFVFILLCMIFMRKEFAVMINTILNTVKEKLHLRKG